MGASSSNYLEWNIDDKWSSLEWKHGEMLGASTGRPIDDNFVIDDDMDSDTVTESNLSLRSRSFLNRVNDQARKRPANVLRFGECLCLRHWKHLYSWERIQKIYIPSQTQGISWEDSPWNQLSLVNDDEVISLSHAKVNIFSDSVLCL